MSLVRSRKSVKSVARLQDSDISRVVQRAPLFARKLWRIADAAAGRVAIGKPVQAFDKKLVDAAILELAGTMLFAFNMRMRLAKKRRSIMRQATLKLSVDSDARRIADAFDLDLGKLRNKFVDRAGVAVRRSLDDIRDVMNKELARATKKGLATSDARDSVLEALDRHGVQPKNTSYVETLVRTHAAISYGAAAKLSFKEDEDVWGFEYTTVGDDRVRPEHEELEGITLPKDHPFWEKYWPPNGWNCRCQAIAIYDDNAQEIEPPDDVDVDESFEGDFTDLVD